MKKFLSALFLLSCAVLFGAVSDWSGYRLFEDGFTLRTPGNENFGGFQFFPESRKNSAKISFENGKMTIDTREFFREAKAGEEVTLRLPVGKFTPDRKARLSVEMSASPNAEFEFYFEGRDIVNSKDNHYWRAKRCLAGETSQVFEYEEILPASLKELHLRLTFRKAAVFTLGAYDFTEVREAAVDSEKENVVNGGAERGLYGVAYSDMKTLGSHKDGTSLFFNIPRSGALKVETDSTTAHSGKRSFKVTTPANSVNQLYMFPVPVRLNKPISLSAWMKAEKPTNVTVGLFPCNGSIYAKTFTVGTVWKKYTLNVPAYGKTFSNVNIVGNPGYAYGDAYGLIFPRFDFPENATVWIDDISSKLSENAEFRELSSVWISGTLDRDSTCYYPEDTITANLKLESAGKTAETELSWRIEDAFGKRIASSPAERVTLPAEKSVSFKAPENRRGWMTLYVTAKTGDRIDEHVLPFGVINHPGPMVRRFGINVEDPLAHNANVTIALMKEFRLGSARVWNSGGHGFEGVGLFHDAGIYTLFCLDNVLSGKEAFFLPKDYRAWKKYLTEKAGMVKGKVDAYEILNEPNIWSGRSANPDPERLEVTDIDSIARCTLETAEILRKIDPNAKIAGADPCGTNVAWIESLISKPGVAATLDIISEHPYRQLPELPDYGEDMQSLRKMAARFKTDYKFFATEAGRVYPMNYPDNRIMPQALKYAARDVRNEIVGFANGVDVYFHFAVGIGFCQTGWTVVRTGNGENGGEVMPNIYLYAIRVAADRIEDGKPAGQVKLGANFRCYIFDLGTRRTAVLWKWNGKPEKIEFAKPFRAYDFMGSRIDGTTFELSEFPVYLESEESAAELAKQIASAKLNITDKAFRTSVKITGPHTFAVEVANLTAKPLSGTVSVLTPGLVDGEQKLEFRDIPGESTDRVAFRTVPEIGMTPREAKLKVELPAIKQSETVSVSLRALFVPKAEKAIAIDGDLSDWQDVAPVVLTVKNSVQSSPWSESMKKSTVKFRSKWDSARLYLAFEVKKDGFHPVDTHGESATWLGDGVQFALDTVANAPKGTAGYQDDDFEYLLSLYQGKPLLNRLAASASSYDSLSKSLGRTDQGDCAIRRTADGVVYELALPPVSISPFKLLPGSATRFSFIVNMNDGEKRVGWIELTPGIGQQPKRPDQFMDMVLLP